MSTNKETLGSTVENKRNRRQQIFTNEFVELGVALRDSIFDEKKLTKYKSFLNRMSRKFDTENLTTLLILVIVTIKIQNGNSSVSVKEIAHYLGFLPIEMLKFKQNFEELNYKEFVSPEIFIFCTNSILKNSYSPADSMINLFLESKLLKKHNTKHSLQVELKRLIYTIKARSTPFPLVLKHFEILEETYNDHNAVQFLKSEFPQNPTNRLLIFFLREMFVLGLEISLNVFYDQDNFSKARSVQKEMADDKHPIMKSGLIELKKDVPNFIGVVLTEKGKDKLGEFAEYSFGTKNGECEPKDKLYLKNINSSANISFEQQLTEQITTKKLFFSAPVTKQLEDIYFVLNESGFERFQKKATENTLTSGICSLFYGPPGTGKTESVYQIAKETNRPIKKIDVSSVRSKWYGETDGQVRKIFRDYASECTLANKTKTPIPILFLNEADSLLTRRFDNTEHGAQYAENSLKTIFLEELENLNGILFATTNVAKNLDIAFERRFLFKVLFEKPDTETKVKIWKSKLPEITDEVAWSLANKFNFSGGEIDNIARKIIIEKMIRPVSDIFEIVFRLCETEQITDTHPTVGFNVTVNFSGHTDFITYNA